MIPTQRRTLYDVMSERQQDALASLLGFSVHAFAPEQADFRNNLRAIPAPPPGFTMQEACSLYLMHLLREMSVQIKRQGEPT